MSEPIAPTPVEPTPVPTPEFSTAIDTSTAAPSSETPATAPVTSTATLPPTRETFEQELKEFITSAERAPGEIVAWIRKEWAKL